LWAVYDFFSTPYMQLWAAAPYSREYGTVHYWLFQDETRGPTFVPDVWRRCCEARWQDALDAELEERGDTFDETLVEFSIWNAITDERDDGAHYRLGTHLPSVWMQAKHKTYPVVDAEINVHELAREAGSNYVRFVGPGSRERLVIEFDGEPESSESRRVSFIATRDVNRHRIWTLSPDIDGDCRIEIPNWPAFDDVTMIVTNFADLERHWEFTYSAREEGEMAAPDLLALSPNPTMQQTRFTVRVPEETRVKLLIYDVNGRVIRRVYDNILRRGVHVITWNGLRERRHPNPAGVYFYELWIGERRLTDQIVRLR
jgi:hypothetical protein